MTFTSWKTKVTRPHIQLLYSGLSSDYRPSFLYKYYSVAFCVYFFTDTIVSPLLVSLNSAFFFFGLIACFLFLALLLVFYPNSLLCVAKPQKCRASERERWLMFRATASHFYFVTCPRSTSCFLLFPHHCFSSSSGSPTPRISLKHAAMKALLLSLFEAVKHQA